MQSHKVMSSPDDPEELSNDDGRVLILISRFSEPTGLGLRYNALVVLVSSYSVASCTYFTQRPLLLVFVLAPRCMHVIGDE